MRNWVTFLFLSWSFYFLTYFVIWWIRVSFVRLAAKHVRTIFPPKISSNRIFFLIHIDVWGPFGIQTMNECQYFIFFIDYYLLHLLKLNTMYVFKLFVPTMQKNICHINSRVSWWKGIIHETSCSYTALQNGAAEKEESTSFISHEETFISKTGFKEILGWSSSHKCICNKSYARPYIER